MKKFLISLCLVLGVAMPAFAATDMIPLDKAPNKLNDLSALQNGAKIFVNYCLNCHAAAYMRFNRLKDIGLTDKQIKELNIEITPLHPETELRKAGVLFESQTAFRDILATHVTDDDEQRFVTGQNQNSGLETAHKMMQVAAERE